MVNSLLRPLRRWPAVEAAVTRLAGHFTTWPVDEFARFVRAPVGGNHGRLLLLNDLPPPSQLTSWAIYDSLYRNLAQRLIPGQFDVLRTAVTQPFRSVKDVQQTFALFDAVIWYRGPRADLTPWAASYQSGVDSALAHGARLFVEGQNLRQRRRKCRRGWLGQKWRRRAGRMK